MRSVGHRAAAKTGRAFLLGRSQARETPTGKVRHLTSCLLAPGYPVTQTHLGPGFMTELRHDGQIQEADSGAVSYASQFSEESFIWLTVEEEALSTLGG